MHKVAGVAAAFLIVGLGSALAAPASATSPGVPLVHEIGAVGLPPSAPPLQVPGRAPAARFRDDLAGASSRRVRNPASIATRTNGKIVGFGPGEGEYSCSGTAINTPSRSIVLTAGHCVVEAGRVGRHLGFVPAYDHGIRPFGIFRVRAIYVMPQWRRWGNPDFDLAALRVGRNELGRLTDVVGARGVATSKSRHATFRIFGYPAAALLGEELRSCRAHGLGSDPLTNVLVGPPTLPASCDMAAGASGGGWIYRDEYVNGVTSYAYARRPTRLHSPYFGPRVAAFLSRLP